MIDRTPRKLLLIALIFGSHSAIMLKQALADGPGSFTVVLTGKDALGDWTTDAPGVRRKITSTTWPRPSTRRRPTTSPGSSRRPEGALPQAPKGFKVTEFATGLRNPRKIVTAPNGDLFVAESMPNRIKVLRDADGDGKPEVNEVFATGLEPPVRDRLLSRRARTRRTSTSATPTRSSASPTRTATRRRGAGRDDRQEHPQRPTSRSAAAATGRATSSSRRTARRCSSRSARGRTSATTTSEKRRADILAFDPDGKNERIFASGIRNAVGLAIHPETGQLWASVNERDALGDHLVPDYVTHVEEGGFYGWPWYYLGPHQDPRHKGKHPELKDKVIVPDVLVQSHSASLGMTFYTGEQFPKEYRLDAFAAEHGSWNRARRTGYKVIRVPMKDGKATGEYEDFLVGFVTPEGNVWGRPVGVTVAKDGALLVTDDGSGTVWRVAYTGSVPELTSTESEPSQER